MVDDFTVGNQKRTLGTITKKLSPSTYEVEVSPGRTCKRHADQMIKYSPQKDEISGDQPDLNEKNDLPRKPRRLKRLAAKMGSVKS